ncbi:MAG: NAD(P)H-dependent oxidoreductase [Candidatus Heimdallarchaeota archaeon]
MIKTLFLNGSPRGKKSTSFSIGNYLEEQFKLKGLKSKILNIRSQIASEEKIAEILNEIENSDVIILAAPVYDDCQPYIVTKLMEFIAAKNMDLSKKRFFPIINCGLPEHIHITASAIPIYHKFAKTVGFNWVGSLAVQGGEMFQGRTGKLLSELGKMADPLKNVLNDVVEAISNDNILPNLAPKIFPGIFYWKILQKPLAKMNTKGWRNAAKDIGEDPDARPYLD